VTDISIDECQANFCPTGVEGYSEFLDALIGWMRDNAKWLGTGFALYTLVQLCWLINVWNLRKSKESKVYPDGGGADSKKKTKKGKGSDARSAV